MEFVCYADLNQLRAGCVDPLFDESTADSVFFSLQWFENLLGTALEEDQSVLFACVVEADQILAILPLMTCDGQHLHGLTHLYSSLYSLLLSQHGQAQIVDCLARGLDQMSITSLRLAPVAEDDPNINLLQQALQSLGYECHRRFKFYNWVHRVQGQSFDDYMASRPSRVRNTITRKQRKLKREHGYHISLYTDQQLQQALADYNQVYRSSWKAHEQHEAFVAGLATCLSAPGWLRLAVLYIENKPAAAQFWFVVHGKASIFKLVYDETWKQYSPGSILISYLMQHVIENDQVEEIDFLTGNDAYKQDWMSQRRQRWTLSFFKPQKSGSITSSLINPLKTMFLRN